MADVREALGLHEPLYADGPGPAHVREVVAAEVDEHDVLCLVLLGAEELVLVSRRGRAGDRIDGRAPVLDLDQRLRRGADQRQPVELEQEEVGRRIDEAERLVELDRRGARRPLDALREDDLEDVPGDDVLLRAAHQLLVRGGGLDRAVDGRRGSRQPGRIGPVIEADQLVRDEEPALGERRAVAGQRHGRLQAGDVVVREVADDPLAAGLGLLERDDSRAAPDEGVAAEPTVLDRFEQERRSVSAQAEIRLERRFGGYVSDRAHTKKTSAWRSRAKQGAGRSRSGDAPATLVAPGPGPAVDARGHLVPG